MSDLKRFILGKFSSETGPDQMRSLAQEWCTSALGDLDIARAVYSEQIADNPRGDPFMFDFVIEAWMRGDAEMDTERSKSEAARFGIDPDRTHTVLAEEKVIKSGSAAVKGMFLSKRRPGSTVEEYQAYWRNQHAEIIQAQKDFFSYVRAYAQNHFVPGTYATLSGDRLQQADSFDGSPQMWFDQAEDIHRAFATDGYQKHIKADEKILVKVGYSQSFIAREYPVTIS